MLRTAMQLGLLTLGLMAGTSCTTDGTKGRSPHWDQDGCARCRMAVSEPPPAAQLVAKGGLARHYDDLGCLIEDQAAKPELAEAVAYVLKPGSTTEWVRADQLRFASGVKTPMGFGFVASDRGELSLADVVAKVRSRDRPRHGAH